MRISLGFLVVGLTSQAGAIGFCEDVEDTARVVGLGPDRVAVERVQEICDEDEGQEQRRKLLSVEILDGAGNTLERYARGGTTPEELAEVVGEARPEAELRAALDALKPANSMNNPRCAVETKRSEGHLTLVVRGDAVLHEQEITDQADPEAKGDGLVKTFWLASGAAVVEVQVPLLINQGALGNASGKLSTVLVLGTDVVPALTACAGKAPEAAPPTAAPASQAAPASEAPPAPASDAPASAAP